MQLTCDPWTRKLFVFVKPDILSLKNDKDIQIEAAKTFIEFIEGKHKDIKLSKCGLFVDEAFAYVGASPDRIFLWSCCEKAYAPIQ